MTLVEAQAQLDAWLAASLALARNRSYSIGDRQLTRADGSEVREMIAYWRREVRALTAVVSGGSASYAVADFSDPPTTATGW